MSAWLVLAGVVLAASSGIPGLIGGRRGGRGERAATALILAAAALGITGAVLALAGGDGAAAAAGALRPAGIAIPWSVPGGLFALRVDAVAALFVIQVFVLAGAGSVYGLEYWAQAHRPDDGRALRFFYGLCTAAMALQVVSRNSILFLVAWEVMALSAFFLVTAEDRQPAVREVGYVYLVATRLGTLCLLAMFVLLHHAAGSWDLDAPLAAGAAPGVAAAIFLLGLAGFGLKAGIMPLHVWLPGAHASAPSHVSALMSGVLIKMGIHGLVRLGALFADPPLWWGGLLLGLGTASAVLGVTYAIAQHDLKRLLAYHSVENIGIIVMGLGLALIGRTLGQPALIALGLAGALLHTFNHGLFKGLLFLGAGAVVHATGTRALDRLGGLAKTMPRTAALFLVGAVAICGLPPLNGFVSELFVYLGLFRTVTEPGGFLWLGGAASAPLLALVGALALACFVKVVGVVFLGEPRSDAARAAHEPGARMLAPMALLAAGCALIGLFPALVSAPLDRAAAAFWAVSAAAAGHAAPVRPAALASVVPLGAVGAAAGILVGLLAVTAFALRARLGRAPAAAGPTWDCGYAAPAATMQYTASSFARTIVRLFAWALRPESHEPHLPGPFPHAASYSGHVPDVALDRAIAPAARGLAAAAGWLRWMQRGSVHVYLVYMLVTLIALMLWR